MVNNTLRHSITKPGQFTPRAAVSDQETSSLWQYSLSVLFIAELDRRT